MLCDSQADETYLPDWQGGEPAAPTTTRGHGQVKPIPPSLLTTSSRPGWLAWQECLAQLGAPTATPSRGWFSNLLHQGAGLGRIENSGLEHREVTLESERTWV